MPDYSRRDQLSRWIEALERSAEGRAFLSNLLFDCSYLRLARTVIRRFLISAADTWSHAESAETPESIASCCTSRTPKFFYCRGLKVPSVPRDCSRIMDSRIFLAYNVDQTKIPFSITGLEDEHVLRLIEAYGLTDAAQGTMSTKRPFAWVTRTSAIDELRHLPHRDSLADSVRNACGLRFPRHRLVVEVVYPSITAALMRLTAPTALDAGPSLVFRSQSAPDGWGRAVNISTLGDGLPEAVHRTTEFTEDFKVRLLGRLLTSAPLYGTAAFLRAMPCPWGDERASELLDYV